MRMNRFVALGLAVAFGVFAAPAQAQRTQLGTLTCEVAGGVGLIVTSKKDIVCTFQNALGELEIYDGFIRRFGIDIGVTTSGVIVWNVLAPSNVARGALAGNYGGASGEATLVAGLGANVLVGGSRRSVALQPISLTGQTGLNVAIGVSDLSLTYRPPEGVRRRR